MLHLYPQKKHLVGIDIRQNFLRLVELAFYKNTYQVINCAHLVLPGPLTSDKTLKTALTVLLQQTAIQSRNIAIALPQILTISKEYQLEIELPASKLHDFITTKLTEQLGQDATQLAFSQQTTTTQNNSYNIINVIATPQQHINRWTNIFNELNCQLQVMDVENHTLARITLWQICNTQKHGLNILINIDNAHLLMLAINETKIVYQYEDFLDPSQLDSLFYLLKIIAKNLQLLDTMPQSLILSGNTVLLPGLIELITDKLQLTTTLASPFSGMTFAPSLTKKRIQQLSSLMTISCGLALQAAPTKNLLTMLNNKYENPTH